MQITRRLPALALTLTLAPALLLPGARAEAGGPGGIDYAGLNAALVENYVLPRYAAFAEATAALETELTASCADDRLSGEEGVAAYHDAMDAWMGVQHLRFGPSELFLRTERIAFWPDKRGKVRRHLAQMLSDRDPKSLEETHFANGSVAVQGFPALERLIFDSDEKTWTTPFGCQVVVAIGHNLASIAAGLLSDWRDGDKSYAAVVRGAAGGNATYFDAREATLDFAKALRGALLLVADYKLDRPLGGEAKSQRKSRAESWRSARSLRNITINLRSAQALYGDGSGFSGLLRAQEGGGELDRQILAAFDHLIAAAEAQPESFEAAFATPDGWQKLDALRTESRALLELLGVPLSQALDLPLGFNSYDGD